MFKITSAKYNVTISLFYFEVGHSQSSGDSMHSAIEQKGKNKEIFTQEQWISVIKAACVKHPYVVLEFNHRNIFDFHKPAAIFPWRKVKIQKIREIKFLVNNLIQIRYDNYDSNYGVKFFDDSKIARNFMQ